MGKRTILLNDGDEIEILNSDGRTVFSNIREKTKSFKVANVDIQEFVRKRIMNDDEGLGKLFEESSENVDAFYEYMNKTGEVEGIKSILPGSSLSLVVQFHPDNDDMSLSFVAMHPFRRFIGLFSSGVCSLQLDKNSDTFLKILDLDSVEEVDNFQDIAAKVYKDFEKKSKTQEGRMKEELFFNLYSSVEIEDFVEMFQDMLESILKFREAFTFDKLNSRIIEEFPDASQNDRGEIMELVEEEIDDLCHSKNWPVDWA